MLGKAELERKIRQMQADARTIGMEITEMEATPEVVRELESVNVTGVIKHKPIFQSAKTRHMTFPPGTSGYFDGIVVKLRR